MIEPEELAERLQEEPPGKKVVLMPDFFLDRVVRYQGTFEDFAREAQHLIEQGGGNLPKSRQEVLRGGNATNAASALARLGMRPCLILRTDPLGASLLKHFLGESVDLSHVKSDGRLALTVALEFKQEGRVVNLMIGDAGSVADFGFNSLLEEDLALLKEADVVCIFNWNLNLKGTELAEHAFRLVKQEGVGTTFFDSGDPSTKAQEVGLLMERVLKSGLVDAFSLNENEAFWYASLLDESLSKKRAEAGKAELALECARVLSSALGLRVDLHTADFSASFRDGKEVTVPAFRVEVLRATGAGDAWNAGDIYGECAGFSDEERLLLANAVAGFYVSDEFGRHPTRQELALFLNAAQLKELRVL